MLRLSIAELMGPSLFLEMWERMDRESGQDYGNLRLRMRLIDTCDISEIVIYNHYLKRGLAPGRYARKRWRSELLVVGRQKLDLMKTLGIHLSEDIAAINTVVRVLCIEFYQLGGISSMEWGLRWN